jgi:hypothetical protein
MKFVIIILLFISSSALCQKPDTLKIPVSQVKKLNELDAQLKSLEPVKQQINALEFAKAQLIEAAFEYKNLPVPQKTQYSNGVILFIKDEEKKK